MLEPEGTVEIKFRFKDLQKAMHRCDAICQRLLAEIQSIDSSREGEGERRLALQKELKAREEFLLPMYHSVAVQFVDMHDTSNGRMLEKNVIRVRHWVTNLDVDNNFYSGFRKRFRGREQDKASIGV